MESLKLFSIVLFVAITMVAPYDTDDNDDIWKMLTDLSLSETERNMSSRGVGRFLAQKNQTCDKFPRVCRSKGSPGPDCCKKKCVTVKTDRLNCGKCGHKCRSSEICCKGKCVDVKTDRLNCGMCGKKCTNSELCCKGKCVDVKTDGLNCGICDHKCRYSEMCCKRKCVNAFSDRKHCGGCNRKCKKGVLCELGMCNYA